MTEDISDLISNAEPSPAPRKRGTCSVCGDEAWSENAYTCKKHRTRTSRREAQDGTQQDFKVQQPDPPSKEAAGKPDKSDRARVLKHSILQDVNPALVQGFALVCKPVPAENFFTVTKTGKPQPTSLGEQVMLAEWQADILGRCAAELETSPIAQSASMIAGPLLPYLYGVGAVVVLAMHTMKVLSVRDQLIAQWTVLQEQAERERNATPNTNGSSSTVNAPFTEESVA